MATATTIGQSRSGRVYEELRGAILAGRYEPEQALKPQEIANEHSVSLAVVRESLLRLVGEGLAVRIQNRGFAVPTVSAERWQEIAEARVATEPNMLRLAIERGDLGWEARVRATHHTLSRTPMYAAGESAVSAEWEAAHHDFHRALLDGCGNSVLMEFFARLWDASELARRWSATARRGRDVAGEHESLERAALERDADAAASALAQHVGATAANLRLAASEPRFLSEKGT